MRGIPEHPLIERCLRTGYPYPVHDLDTDDDYEEDNDDELDDYNPD